MLVYVSRHRYNTRMTINWNKHTYICNTCDGLFEMTISSYRTIDQKLCPSCFNSMTLLSVEDATIQPTTTKEEKMEATFGETVTEASVGVDILSTRIKQLEDQVQRVTQRSYDESAERNRMRNEMQEWTLEALDESSITESQAEEIASICGFELTTEFEVEVTVTYSLTVNVRDKEQAENAIHDIDFDTVSYDDPITYLSSSIDSIEVD